MNSQQWTSKLGFVLAAAGSKNWSWGDLEIPIYGGIGGGGAFF